MRTSDEGLDLIKSFEGCRLEAYQDSVGIWTIGYGHIDGVAEGDTCTSEEADEFLRKDLNRAETCVDKSVAAPLTQGEFDALVSFVFNLGCGALHGSTLLRKLNAGDFDGAGMEFLRWNRAGGHELAGLTRRREAEKERFEA